MALETTFPGSDLFPGDTVVPVPAEDDFNLWTFHFETQLTELAVDNLDPNTEYEIQIRAVSTDGVTSDWTDSIWYITPHDADAPSVPSAPIVTAKLGAFTVTWDGKTENGGKMEPDFAYVNVWANSTKIGSISVATGGTIAWNGGDYGATYAFSLSSVDTNGNESVRSETTGQATVPIVDADLINAKIDGANIQPGTINAADAIIGNTITGDLIEANSIDGDRIKANSITADQIDTGFLNGTTVSGVTIIGGQFLSGTRETGTDTDKIGWYLGSDGAANVRAANPDGSGLPGTTFELLKLDPTNAKFSVGIGDLLGIFLDPTNPDATFNMRANQIRFSDSTSGKGLDLFVWDGITAKMGPTSSGTDFELFATRDLKLSGSGGTFLSSSKEVKVTADTTQYLYLEANGNDPGGLLGPTGAFIHLGGTSTTGADLTEKKTTGSLAGPFYMGTGPSAGYSDDDEVGTILKGDDGFGLSYNAKIDGNSFPGLWLVTEAETHMGFGDLTVKSQAITVNTFNQPVSMETGSWNVHAWTGGMYVRSDWDTFESAMEIAQKSSSLSLRTYSSTIDIDTSDYAARLVLATAQGGASFLRSEGPGDLAGITVQNSFGTSDSQPNITLNGLQSTSHTGSTTLWVSTGGRIYLSSSAAKYKADIETVDFGDSILDIEPRTWYDKGATDTYAALYEESGGDMEKFQELVDTADLAGNPFERIAGVIAEEVEAAGLKEFVHYNEDGEIRGVQYERLWIPLIPIIKKLRDEVAALKAAQNS